ncbi:NAD-dependent epimerase/dehydratase family protein [Planctomycetes bacterium Pan216]|uniref:NAD-dependent epimerase/dehydratase family protein n=1 Tax=Kolteria novifilia TaxID=2527975 RepID=UPI0011A6BB2A
MGSVGELEERLSVPPSYLVEAFERLEGDLLILGVGGKMGPTLARLARRASELAGKSRRIVGVSRFSKQAERAKLDAWGIETVQADLLDEEAFAALPDAPNVVHMTSVKFGTTGNEALTWAMNTWVPAMVARRFRDSRVVAYSTGNVYPLVPVVSGGSVESDRLEPVGEYGNSCLGRERILTYFSQQCSIPMAIIRLNYACELRYGVLVDLARRVWAEEVIDVSMGAFNVIWQTDACAMALASFEDCDTPPHVLNVSGPETLGVRHVCEEFARRMDKPVTFSGEEAPTALLNNGQQSHQRFGYPSVNATQMIDWVAAWVMRGGETHGKPTSFQVRDGKF